MEGFLGVLVVDMKIYFCENDFIIGIFGCVVWILDDLCLICEMVKIEGVVLKEDFVVFFVLDVYLVECWSYQGVCFYVDVEFVGEDWFYGVLFIVWVKFQEKEEVKEEMFVKVDDDEQEEDEMEEEVVFKKKKCGGDKVKIQVVDSKGDIIWIYLCKLEFGFNCFIWNLRVDGFCFLSCCEVKFDVDVLFGVLVFLGDYCILMIYGDIQVEMSVCVYVDLCICYVNGIWENQVVVCVEFVKIVEVVIDGFNCL